MKYSVFIKSKLKKYYPYLIIIAVLILFYAFIGCPTKVFLGVTCPGCGMSRAAEALLKLDFQLAFQMHPLIFFMPAALIILLIRKKIPPKIFDILLIVAAVGMFAVYFFRLFSGSEVVYIDFKEGLIYKLLQNVFG
ncbi:MAG: DUF2752 domain-containing protein [Acutalibacteraceae bacterium]|nr:DUF2752 domain-containing protein [Acutalibacteraceae bacterium]